MSHVDEGTLHGYLDGELAPEEARGVAAHLAECPACRNRLDEERALIARAGELLALATPPDREIPPFRAGDPKPPARLWWKVRLPLAWAATVFLALGIGMRLGGRPATPGVGRPETEGYADLVAGAPLESANAPETATAKRSGPRPARQRARPLAVGERKPVEAAAPVTEAPGHPVSGLIARDSERVEAATAREAVQPSLSLDSARALLGQEVVALPGIPIRAVRRERALGETVIVLEQALDAATVIELRERMPAPMRLEAVVVAGAAQDSVAAEKARGAAPRLYAQAEHPSLPRAQGRIVQEQDRPVLQLGNLRVEISGPLSADSLRKLLERVKPVRP